MKNFVLIVTILLSIFSCKKENFKNNVTDSATISKDSVAIVVDSATAEFDSIFKIQHPEDQASNYEEPKDGYYTKDYIDGDLKAKVYYRRNNSDVRYYRIDVFKNLKKIQTINQEPEHLFTNYDDFGLSFEDANFDRKKDILILKFVGMNFDHQYLFLNIGGKYIKYRKFEEVVSPQVDTINKLITSNYRSGSEHFSKIYKWKKGKLMKISESYYDEEHPE